MGYNQKLRYAQQDTGDVAAAGVAGTVFAGPTLLMSKVQPGTLMARIKGTIATGSLTFAPSWQVSDDGTVWENVVPMNNAANVTFSATATKHLEGPPCLSGKRYCRAVLTGAGATASTGDFTRFSYSYLLNDFPG
jgi:hypothetical protein